MALTFLLKLITVTTALQDYNRAVALWKNQYFSENYTVERWINNDSE